MSLTAVEISQAKPRDKEYKLSDGGGLYLLIRPNGAKLWKHKVRIQGREQKLSYGSYPLVSLNEARTKRDETKLAMTRGEDPVQKRREDKLAAMFRSANRFADVAEEFIDKREKEGVIVGEATDRTGPILAGEASRIGALSARAACRFAWH